MPRLYGGHIGSKIKAVTDIDCISLLRPSLDGLRHDIDIVAKSPDGERSGLAIIENVMASLFQDIEDNVKEV